MGETALVPSHAEDKSTSSIPDDLVYEIARGRPIYYRGYKEVINGNTTLESIMAESSLQAWLKAQLGFQLITQLMGKNYEVLSGELGLLLGGGNRRGADISVYRSDELVLHARFANTPPLAIIEIDTQIDLTDENEMDYVLDKIDDYLNFGVKKVIWIFTNSRKVMIAEPQSPWLTVGWESEIKIVGGASFNLSKMLEGKTIG